MRPLFSQASGKAGRNLRLKSGCTPAQSSPVSQTELVARIHTRMPVILAEEHHEAWLNNQAGKEVLVPFPADAMRAWPISPRVNSPRNNDPDLLRPDPSSPITSNEFRG